METPNSKQRLQAAGNAVNIQNRSGNSAVASGNIESTTANSIKTAMSTTTATGTNGVAADSTNGGESLTPQSALPLPEYPMHSRSPMNRMQNTNNNLCDPHLINVPGQDKQQSFLPLSGHPIYGNNRFDKFNQIHQQAQLSQNENPVGFGSVSNENNGMLFDFERARPNCHTGIGNHEDSGRTSNAPISAAAARNGSAFVSTTAVMSPRVGSSTSPTSTSSNLQASALIGGVYGGGNSVSPIERIDFQCKKCGIMLTKESELYEHISNIHGESPYSSSGYSSSPYIKEEQISASMQQQQQQPCSASNTDEIFDLDSQKLIYSTQHMPPTLINPNDPLHSMHNMQNRPMDIWNKSQTLPENAGYLQQQQQQQRLQSNEQHNQLQYQSSIKQEYPVIKTEYPDPQNYGNNSSDSTAAKICSQSQQSPQQQVIPHSPAEFPSTTTGSQVQQLQSPFSELETPSSSSVLPATVTSPRAATWKSNEARRPKTYNCTACNKWFTSSGHLKRHYNTTLHKNAVKSSGKPDPATLPISMFHHPHRDPNAKSSRRSNAKISNSTTVPAKQQTPVAVPLQPEEPPGSPLHFNQGVGTVQMTHHSATPSPLQPQPLQQESLLANNMSYVQAQSGGYSRDFMHQEQSTSNTSPQNISAANTPSSNTTVLNGHPNGQAGPSAQLITFPTPSSQTRGLLNSASPPATRTIITKNEPMEDYQQQQLLPGNEVLEIFPEMMTEKVEMHQYFQRDPVNIKLSPSTIFNQQFQGHLLEVPQAAGNPFIYTTPPPHPTPSPQLHILTANIMDQQQQPFNSLMDISKPQLQQQHSNNMQLLPPITPMPNTFITNMDKIHMEDHQHHHQQLAEEAQEYQVLRISPVHNTNILPITTHTPIHTFSTKQDIKSYQQLPLCPQQVSDQVPQPQTYLNTIGSINETVASSNQYTIQYFEALSSAFDYQCANAEQEFITPNRINDFPFTTTETLVKDHLPPAQTLLQLRYGSGTNLTSDQNSSSPPITSPENYHLHPTSNSSSDSSGFVDTPKEMKSEGSACATEKARSTKKLTPQVQRIKQASKKCITSSSNISKRISSNSPIPTSEGEKMPDGRIKCNSCSKITTGECYFQQHYNTKHRKELIYRCPKCGKNHATEDILKSHLKNHDEEGKKFKCTYCTKTYARKPDLTRHIQWIHEKNKEQHTCQICKKHFSRNDHMIKHMLIHSRDRKSAKQGKRAKG